MTISFWFFPIRKIFIFKENKIKIYSLKARMEESKFYIKRYSKYQFLSYNSNK